MCDGLSKMPHHGSITHCNYIFTHFSHWGAIFISQSTHTLESEVWSSILRQARTLGRQSSGIVLFTGFGQPLKRSQQWQQKLAHPFQIQEWSHWSDKGGIQGREAWESLVVQWLRLCAPLHKAWVQPLARELESCKLWGVTQKCVCVCVCVCV